MMLNPVENPPTTTITGQSARSKSQNRKEEIDPKALYSYSKADNEKLTTSEALNLLDLMNKEPTGIEANAAFLI